MSQSPGEYAGWSALIITGIAVAPRFLALFTRHRGTQAKTHVDGFTALSGAQQAMLTTMQNQIDSLRRDLEAERQKYQLALGEWTVKFLQLEGQIKDYRERIEYLEHLLTRRGDFPHRAKEEAG